MNVQFRNQNILPSGPAAKRGKHSDDLFLSHFAIVAASPSGSKSCAAYGSANSIE